VADVAIQKKLFDSVPWRVKIGKSSVRDICRGKSNEYLVKDD